MRIDIQPAFLVALIAFAISTACSAAGVPREIADCKVHRVWHFDKSAEGWHPDHNVGEFSVKDGVLSFENTGPDPWIINRSDLDEMDTSAYGFIGIKMRSSASGSNQIYFGTSVSPDTAQDKELDYSIAGDDEFRFYEVDFSVLKTWTGKLTTLRIDPANGRGEVGAKIGIDWIALYQVPARLTMGRPYAGNDDEGVFVCLPIENIGGERSDQDVLVYSEDTQIKRSSLPPTPKTLPMTSAGGQNRPCWILA